MAEGRDRSFGPTVLAGLAAAALAAVASGKDWARASGDAAGVHVAAAAKGSQSAPLAVALSLVALAAWGVVLVVRGRVRRAVAAVGVLATAGVLGAAATSLSRARHDAVLAVQGKGATGAVTDVHLTGWYVAALVAAVLALATFVVAFRRAPGWPAMGSRYDAPGTRQQQPVTDQDLWRALDEGHDPTL